MAHNIYEQIAAAANQPFALALIAGTKGSSPQRAGAKALFFPDGKIIGTLGGGCLEAEVQARALQALKTGQAAEFDLVLDHDFGWDDGLICGGSVSGLILPHAAEAAPLWRRLAMAKERVQWGVKTDFSIADVEENVRAAGTVASVPTGGARGATRPTIEARADRPAAPTLQPLNASTASQWLYQETVSPPVELWVAGSGHVAQAVVPLAQQLNFAVTVFDDRAELANYQYFPSATQLRVGGWHELLKVPPPSAPAFGLVVTRGHQHDALVLSEWIGLPFAFLGMIGSRRKARIMREQFIKQKLATPEQFDRIACPVGLDIAAVGTQEIAVSVMAQLIQRRANLKMTNDE